MSEKMLSQYLELLKRENEILSFTEVGFSEKIFDLSSDSGRCSGKTLFFCKGRNFLSRYAKEAEEKGAVAFVCGNECLEAVRSAGLKDKSTVIIVKNIARAMALCAAFHFDYPMKKLFSVAVTGTKGKTTTVCYINQILNETKEYRSAVLGELAGEDAPRLTTPEAIDFHRAAARGVSLGLTHIVCEISSQAQKALRTYGITFDFACFLNLGCDHIGPVEHKNEEEYFLCKASLFESCRTAFVNIDDRYGKRLLEMLSENVCIRTFSLYDKNADFYAGKIKTESYGCDFKVYEKASGKDYPAVTTTIGEFNAENALCAIAVCADLSVPRNEIFSGIMVSRPKGRGEIIESIDGKITVIVDYAHNRMSFEAMFKTVEKRFPGYFVTAVFGCPGEKAQCRRRQLAEVCADNADSVIICDDDSGSEGFESIKKELNEYFIYLLSGNDCRLKGTGTVFIKDRADAIKNALDLAGKRNKKSVILFFGKGAENKMRVAGGDIECRDDITLAKEAVSGYDSYVKISEEFAKIKRLKGEKILVCVGEGADISREFAASLPYLKKCGVGVCAVCSGKQAESVREDCFKEGIAVRIHPQDKKVFIGKKIESEMVADMSMGVLPVFTSESGIHDLSLRIATFSAVNKFGEIVYLQRHEGIMLSDRVTVKTLSLRRAKIISEMSKSRYIDSALLTLSAGASEFAVIDGRKNKALAFYASGNGYSGTVVRRGKGKKA